MFKLSDIKPGYLLELEDETGMRYRVTVIPATYNNMEVLGCCGRDENDHLRFFNLNQEIDENLVRHTGVSCRTHKVMKIYGCCDMPSLLSNSIHSRMLLWERRKQMTIAQIEKELGYTIEVVSEKETL